MEKQESKPLNIKEWSPEDRPREKLLNKGTSALSDAELLTILIGSGTATLSALDVAKNVLLHVGHDLNRLGKLSAKELMKMKGIGQARAVTILAAVELGRRRKEFESMEQPKITGSKDAYDLLSGELADLPVEEFWIILVNRAHRVIKKKRVSEGGVSGTVADPKVIYKLALEELASGIIVAHNHPSGNLTASQADIELTRKLKDAGKVLEVQLLDHLIVAGKKYFSFADQGIL